MSSPFPGLRRLLRWGFSAWMCVHVLKKLKHNHTMGRKASKSSPLPHHKPNESSGLPHPVNTGILLTKIATLYDFCLLFSSQRSHLERRRASDKNELAAPIWYKFPTCYHLNKDESTTKKYFGVKGECFGEESFWLGGFWVGVITSLILLHITRL